jgi:hypothetical protein
LEAQGRRLPEKTKKIPSPEDKVEKKKQMGEAPRRRRQERQLDNEMVVKGCLLKNIKDS